MSSFRGASRRSASQKPLSVREREKVEHLLEVWRAKLPRNRLRRTYYDAKNSLKDLGIAIPPDLLGRLDAVVGWPAKSVNLPAARSVFDGFAFTDAEALEQDMLNILNANNFRAKYPKVTKGQLMQSCCFATLSRGGKNEPEVIISAYSAEHAAATWDHRLERIGDGITIPCTDESGEPEKVNLYLDDQIVEIKIVNDEYEVLQRHFHKVGRPLMEVFAFEPSLDRPFGHSRISRAVMSITDAAVRGAFRSEVAAETFTSPFRYALGIDSKDDQERFKAWIGYILALGPNSEGETPTLGQLTPTGIREHIENRKDLAAQFSGETGIPISSLGIIHDNPTSAEAIHAAREDLILITEDLNNSNGQALRNIGLMIMAIRDNVPISRLTDVQKSITPRFKNPARPSLAGMADATSKLAVAFPHLAYSAVFLERAGFNESDIMRMRGDLTEARAIGDLDRLLASLPSIDSLGDFDDTS